MKRVFLLFTMLFCSGAAQSQVVDVSSFIAQCNAFVTKYNEGGGRVIPVSFKDWQGNSRVSSITTLIPGDTCINVVDRYSIVVRKSVGPAVDFNFVLTDGGNGSLTFVNSSSNCETLAGGYIQVLKDANWIVNEAVRAAVERMYKDSFCPAVIIGIKEQLSVVSKAVAG